MKIVILLFLAAILYSLGRALYFVMKDKGSSERTVRALTWRVGLSIAVFILIMISFKLGILS